MWGAFVHPAVIESPRNSTPIGPDFPRVRNESCIFRKRPSVSFFSIAADASGFGPALVWEAGVWAEVQATAVAKNKVARSRGNECIGKLIFATPPIASSPI